MSLKASHWIVAGIIVIVGVLLYCYTLNFPFVFDDHIYLVENPLVKDAGSFAYPFHFKSFVALPIQMGLDQDLSVNFILRPVTYLTFYINYVIDGLNPRGFRVINILIHCANALLVYHILLHLFRATNKRDSLPVMSAGFIAFCTSLLFLVHPLQIESVTYIVQRFTSFSTLFYLLTVLTYFRSNTSPNQRTASVLRRSSMGLMVAGMLAKEDVFTAPFMLVAIDRLVIGTPFKAACKRALPFFLFLPMIPTLLVLTSWAGSDGNPSLSGALNVANATDEPRNQYHYLLTQLSVVLSYLRLIVIPLNLNIDPDYPLSTSLFQTPVLVSIALISALLGGAWFAWRRQQDDVRWSLLFCSILWFFVTVAPSSSIAPLPDLMAEHRSYLPSIGALIALVCYADLFRTRFLVARDVRDAMPIFMGVWVLLLVTATVTRNWQWRSNIVLMQDTVSKSPQKVRPLLNLAAAYSCERKEFLKSAACLVKAIQVDPRCLRAYLDLGKSYNLAGMYKEGAHVFETALDGAPGNSNLIFNLAISQWHMGQREKSIDTFHQATQIRPNNKEAHRVLGVALAEMDRYDEALAELRLADSLPPADPNIALIIAEVESLAGRQRTVK